MTPMKFSTQTKCFRCNNKNVMTVPSLDPNSTEIRVLPLEVDWEENSNLISVPLCEQCLCIAHTIGIITASGSTETDAIKSVICQLDNAVGYDPLDYSDYIAHHEGRYP